MRKSCRPYGTRSILPLLPGTPVPGFHMPPLRRWNTSGPMNLSRLDSRGRLSPHGLGWLLLGFSFWGRGVARFAVERGQDAVF